MKYTYPLLALLIVLSSCIKDDRHCEGSPSTFKIRIDNVSTELYQTDDDRYPYTYTPYLTMEDLPEDEYIIGISGFFSYSNTNPDLTDYNYYIPYDDSEYFREWDWNEPLEWFIGYLCMLVPRDSYYFKARVQTNKATYDSNVVEIHPESSTPLAENPDAYRIPVIFHIFPDMDGNYPSTKSLLDQLEYANMVYANYYGLPHMTGIDLRFVPALTAPDGTLLEEPGIRYYTDKLWIDENLEPHDESDDPGFYWDMEQVLNVWVCPITNGVTAGMSFYPFFDEEDMSQGDGNLYDPTNESWTGIFIDSHSFNGGDNLAIFAHEAGHFLGLFHVFEEDFCGDTPLYDRGVYDLSISELWYKREFADAPGTYFLSDNVMDYGASYSCGITPEQKARIEYTLRYAYHIPGPAGKTAAHTTRAGGSRVLNYPLIH